MMRLALILIRFRLLIFGNVQHMFEFNCMTLHNDGVVYIKYLHGVAVVASPGELSRFFYM